MAFGALLFTAIQAVDFETFTEDAKRQIAAATGRTFEADAIAIGLGWPVRLTARDIRIGNADWAEAETMARFQNLEAEIDPWSLLIGSIRLKSLTLLDGQVDLEISKDGRANWALPPNPIGGNVPIPLQDLDALTIRRTNVNWPGLAPASYRMLRLGRAEFDLTGAVNKAVQVSGAWNDNPFEAQVSIAIGGQADGPPLRATVEGKIIGIGFDAAIQVPGSWSLMQSRIDLNWNARTLADVGVLFGQSLPGTAPLTGTATLILADDRVTLDRASLKLGTTDIAGRLEFRRSEGKSRLSGKFKSNNVALGDLPAIAGGTLLQWAKSLDADIEWRGEAIGIDGLTAHSTDGRLAISNGAGKIELKSADFGGGVAAVTVGLTDRGNSALPFWRLTGHFDRVPLADVFQLLQIQPLLTLENSWGEFALEGVGQSFDAWLGDLYGAVRVAAGGGELRPSGQKFLPMLRDPVTCLRGSATITRGLAIAHGIYVQSGASVAVVKGSLDLRGGIVDARVLGGTGLGGPDIMAQALDLTGPLESIETVEDGEVAVQPDDQFFTILRSARDLGADGTQCVLSVGAS